MDAEVKDIDLSEILYDHDHNMYDQHIANQYNNIIRTSQEQQIFKIDGNIVCANHKNAINHKNAKLDNTIGNASHIGNNIITNDVNVFFEKDTNDLLDMQTGVTDATQSIIGQGPFIFSSKRSAYADYERTKLVEKVAALQAQVTTLQAEHVTLHPRAWYDDPTKQIEGAAAVGALGFIFGFIGLVLGAVAMTRVKGLAKNASGGYQI